MWSRKKSLDIKLDFDCNTSDIGVNSAEAYFLHCLQLSSLGTFISLLIIIII